MEQKMGEYARGDNASVNADERMVIWELGLPAADKITPLSQMLIPQELASAFRILMEPCRTILDVDSASKTTLLNIHDGQSQAHNNFNSKEDQTRDQEAMVVEWDETSNPDGSGSDSRQVRKVDFAEEANLARQAENSTEDASARTLKRPRLAWTPQLHKRFVDVVSHLGLKDAVPKNIMQLMNVEGLTRENVASHLQKYRLYLKRTRVSSASDELFVPIPVSQNSRDSTASANAHTNGYFPATFPMTYVPSPMMPIMFLGMGTHGHGHSHTSMPVADLGTAGYGGFEGHSLNVTRRQD